MFGNDDNTNDHFGFSNAPNPYAFNAQEQTPAPAFGEPTHAQSSAWGEPQQSCFGGTVRTQETAGGVVFQQTSFADGTSRMKKGLFDW